MKKPKQGESKEGSCMIALFFGPTKKHLKVTILEKIHAQKLASSGMLYWWSQELHSTQTLLSGF